MLFGNIGLIGAIFVVIGIFLAYKKDIKYNFIYLIVTSILTTTSVVTIGDNSITIPHVVALIFTCKVLYEIYQGNMKFYFMKNSILYYLLFCIVSIPFGILVSKVMNFDFAYSLPSMIIQVIYLIMCICILYTVQISYLNNKIEFSTFHFGLKITTLEIFFLSCFQLINTPVFNFLFVNRAGHAFIQSLENGQQRITATFNEPSMLAIYLSLALIYFTFMATKNIKNLIYVIICLFIGLISRGSAFIFAALFWAVFSFIIIVKKTTFKQLVIICISLIGIIVIVNFITNNLIVNEVLNLIYKLSGQGTSGSERLLHFKQSMAYFMVNPISGLGYGAIRSTDWLTTICANTGIIGIIMLGKFFFTIFFPFETDSIQLRGIKTALFVTVLILLIAVPEPYFNFTWIFMAFALVHNNNENYIVIDRIHRVNILKLLSKK